MKTSNKLLLAATFIMFAYLAIYDFQLKAEYVKGDYKSRFYNMEHTALNSFNAVQNNVGNTLSINIEKGPKFEVWVNKYLKDKVVITQRNNTLYIDNKEKNARYFQTGVTIICPSVSVITTTPHILPDWLTDGKTTVSGFTQDMMIIHANKFTEIELSKNSLGKLDASTGDSKATITVHGDNRIKAARFNIIGKSDLKLFNLIANATYNYTDSATVTLNGKSFKQLQHLN
ncbi:hypothetical protein [Mucilaginibacter sp.]|uniref:hypothetical protein n=1 Tax=Mucilaginibacter sp. TaxID=1882438 RepID=UPI0026389433|nr:hypothetical protein [Mucilaginibacter sp.]MDB5032758.1 hypothetical protein [Mucilaginibacter sp.]